MPVPFFRVRANGTDITTPLAGRGMSLTITDGVGRESDSISLVIDNQDGMVKPPATGAVLEVEGGYLDGEWRNFGKFKVDSISAQGWPENITINAQSADAKSEQKTPRVKSYKTEDFPTYGDIYADVAKRMSLKLSISDEVKGIKNTFEFQAEENDMSFGTRMGDRLDASVSIKSGHLVVAKRGKGTTVGGGEMPPIIVRRPGNLLDYSCEHKDKPKHKEVKATYFDRDKAGVVEVKVAAGQEGPEFLIREPFQSKEEAESAADSAARDLKRGEATADFTIDGTPYARAEMMVHAIGINALVNGLWRSTNVTQNFTAGGPYTTSISCELPPDDNAVEAKAKAKKSTPAGTSPRQAPTPATRGGQTAAPAPANAPTRVTPPPATTRPSSPGYEPVFGTKGGGGFKSNGD